MHLGDIVRLALVFSTGGLLIVAGCGESGETNHPPVISEITAFPADSALIDSSIRLTATATDEDSDVLSFTWHATTGSLSSATGDTVYWTPTAVGACTVSVICTDDAEGADTMTKVVRGYQVWRFNSVQGETSDSTYLPASATTYVPFELDDVVPPNAVIESAFVCTDLEPDTIGEFFRIWVVTPGGSEVLIYDGLNGEPDVDDVLIQGVKGENTKGEWRLKVVRDNSAIERYADVCDIDIYYRY